MNHKLIGFKEVLTSHNTLNFPSTIEWMFDYRIMFDKQNVMPNIIKVKHPNMFCLLNKDVCLFMKQIERLKPPKMKAAI